ncbi:hypothetical protein [Streptomyces sp. NPDC090029]|uniref:hypothetical protein n=1 Tax=Streptomyces sp. NPDC090029 TaxID=3365924 RepID=UPI003802C03F
MAVLVAVQEAVRDVHPARGHRRRRHRRRRCNHPAVPLVLTGVFRFLPDPHSQAGQLTPEPVLLSLDQPEPAHAQLELPFGHHARHGGPHQLAVHLTENGPEFGSAPFTPAFCVHGTPPSPGPRERL